MANPNIELLTSIANAMGTLREQVVFVGGCATGLLITQPIVADARATEDVDAIVEVASLVKYHALPGIVSQSSRTGLVLQRFTSISEL